ncbi:MAG TPA: DUF1269 domain-containing protein [Puia sp.]|nr:DUF1269 domain-containing protein [Puia sp.]
MTNLIVGSFDNESQAITASHRLNELESYGDITVYEKVIVKKNYNDEASVIQADTSDGVRTLSGMAIGTLVGAIAGPVGLLVGMFTGTLIGAVAESDYFDFSDDFYRKVNDRLQPGTFAVIAEVYEESPDIIDHAFNTLGATAIFRSDVDYVYDDYVDEQVEETDEAIDAERAKIKSANAAEKTKIQQNIANLKDKRRKRIAELKEKHQTNREKRRASRKEARKARLEKRIYRHQTRIEKLEEKVKELD